MNKYDLTDTLPAVSELAFAIAQIDEVKCILCGYCTSVCPHFALRLD